MRVERIQLAGDIAKLVEDSDYLFFVSYKGLNVEAFNELRDKLHEGGARCHVLKNSYIALGLQSREIEPLDGALAGDTAVVFGSGDPCPPAKAIKEFAKAHGEVAFKGGVLDNAFISGDDAKGVADLPPLEVAQAQLLGLLQAPAGNLVRTLNAKIASIVYVLKAYEDKLSEQA